MPGDIYLEVPLPRYMYLPTTIFCSQEDGTVLVDINVTGKYIYEVDRISSQWKT